MPLLDQNGYRELRTRQAQEYKVCDYCTAQVWRNYCRECDEFFEDGHYKTCPHETMRAVVLKHAGHRKY
jgi:hypothetical protein